MAKKKDMDFGKAFEELRATTEWFERGTPDLEEGLERFERAMELSSVLKEKLSSAENRVKEIRAKHQSDN